MQTNISVDRILNSESSSDRLVSPKEVERKRKIFYPGKRNGLFRFKNCVISVILSNRKEMKATSIVMRIK